MSFNVLIVDDSPAMRKFIRRILSMTDVDLGICFEAGNGEEALRLLAEQPVDLVFTDINMPVMNGEEFMRRLSADPKLNCIPVIVASTDSTDTRIAHMMALGAKGYIRKPFQPEQMRDQLDRVLEHTDA